MNKNDIWAMPKTDLHVHLDGSVRIQTVLDLAKRNSVKLPSRDPEHLRELLVPGLKCGNLVEYLRIFEIILSVMQEGEAISRVAFELAEDAAEENVRYMEVRFSPDLHTRRGLNPAAVIDAVKDEPLVKLSELDLKQWEAYGAPKDTIERICKEGL